MGSGFNWPRNKKVAIDQIVSMASRRRIKIPKKNLQGLPLSFLRDKLWGCLKGGRHRQFITYLDARNISYQTIPIPKPVNTKTRKIRTRCPACGSKLSEPGNTLSCWCQK